MKAKAAAKPAKGAVMQGMKAKAAMEGMKAKAAAEPAADGAVMKLMKKKDKAAMNAMETLRRSRGPMAIIKPWTPKKDKAVMNAMETLRHWFANGCPENEPVEAVVLRDPYLAAVVCTATGGKAMQQAMKAKVAMKVMKSSLAMKKAAAERAKAVAAGAAIKVVKKAAMNARKA